MGSMTMIWHPNHLCSKHLTVECAKLEEQELSSIQCASLIEEHLREVDEALAIIRSGVEAGMDWKVSGSCPFPLGIAFFVHLF